MYYNVADFLLFFLIYGFAGFVLESSYGSIVSKKLSVRGGFLTNYFCPLYGICGMVIIQIFTTCEIFFTNRFFSIIIATLGSVIAVTLLEYFSGFTLDRAFQHKMWDYSKSPFNLHGYICLEFSIIWGIIVLLLSNFIHPVIEAMVYAVPSILKYFSVSFIAFILIINASINMDKFFHIRKLRL